MTLSDHYHSALKAEESHPLLDELDAEIHEPMESEMEDLNELRRLAHEACGLPWRTYPGESVVIFPGSKSGRFDQGGFDLSGCPFPVATAQYIVAACNAVPALIAELDRLRALVHPAPATAETSGAMDDVVAERQREVSAGEQESVIEGLRETVEKIRSDVESLKHLSVEPDIGLGYQMCKEAADQDIAKIEAAIAFLSRPLPSDLHEWVDKNEQYIETWGIPSDTLRELFAGKRLIPAPAAAPDGGQTDCTPAREAKCKCGLSGKILEYPVCQKAFQQRESYPGEYCNNLVTTNGVTQRCGHDAACHALGNTAGDGKEDGR